MSLSCYCFSSLEDFDAWWEYPVVKIMDRAGEKCCECCRPLSVGEEVSVIYHYEVYDPDDVEDMPAEPSVSLPDEEFAAAEEARDKWLDDRGWDWDYERFTRELPPYYRCERCSDLAFAFSDLGFCAVAPGELIDTHAEYTRDYNPGSRPVKWEKNEQGIWNPRRVRVGE